MELQFDSPVGSGFGTKTGGTLNPGVAYVDETYQLSVEAIVPLNHRGGSPGFRLGAVFLIPALFGKPAFH